LAGLFAGGDLAGFCPRFGGEWRRFCPPFDAGELPDLPGPCAPG
jgi:hypothetical protein